MTSSDSAANKRPKWTFELYNSQSEFFQRILEKASYPLLENNLRFRDPGKTGTVLSYALEQRVMEIFCSEPYFAFIWAALIGKPKAFSIIFPRIYQLTLNANVRAYRVTEKEKKVDFHIALPTLKNLTDFFVRGVHLIP